MVSVEIKPTVENRRYILYSRNKFNDWRDRVKLHLPFFVTEFYRIKGHVDYDKHKLLGRVILGINDPYYTLVDFDMKKFNRDSEVAAEIILEIQVNELFSFVKKNQS